MVASSSLGDVRSTLRDCGSSPWVDELAEEVGTAKPLTPEELVELISTALERKLISHVPLRRAPRLSEKDDINTALQETYGDLIPPAHHIGRQTVSDNAHASDMRELLEYRQEANSNAEQHLNSRLLAVASPSMSNRSMEV